MGGKTVTRDILSQAMCKAAGAAHVTCTDALAAGEDVKITGLGTFRVHDKAARIGRNPKTGETALITSRRAVTFKPSNDLRDQVKRGNRNS